MQRFEFLRQPLMGELAMSRKKERKKERKMPFVVATYVYACSPRAAHALRSDQNSGHFVLQQCLRAAHALHSDQNLSGIFGH